MGCVWAGRGRTTCNQAPATAAGAREGKIIPRHNEMLELDGGWWRLVAMVSSHCKLGSGSNQSPWQENREAGHRRICFCQIGDVAK